MRSDKNACYVIICEYFRRLSAQTSFVVIVGDGGGRGDGVIAVLFRLIL